MGPGPPEQLCWQLSSRQRAARYQQIMRHSSILSTPRHWQHPGCRKLCTVLQLPQKTGLPQWRQLWLLPLLLLG